MNTLIETLHHDIYKSFVLAHPNSKTKLLAKLWDLHSEQEYGDRNKGEWLNSKKHGKGIETWPNGYIYEGDFFDSKWQGDGTLTFPDGSKYIGQWVEDNMNGQGTFTLADGTIRKGIWKNGVLVESN